MSSGSGIGFMISFVRRCALVCTRASQNWSRSCTSGRLSFYEAAGELREAIAHALAAPDYLLAASLMEQAAPAVLAQR